jgi:hypothetical protein
MAGVGWRASVRLEVWGALSIVFGLVKKGMQLLRGAARDVAEREGI